MTAKDSFQYLLTFLVLFWPLWALVLAFLRWLVVKKIGLVLGRLKPRRFIARRKG